MRFRLTQLAVDKARPDPAKRLEVPDHLVPGLRLCLFPSGKRSWIIRTRVGTRTAKLTLGDAAILPLADARDRARSELRKVAAGVDPRQERREREDAAERQRRNTIAAAVELWLAKDQAGNRTSEEVRRTMVKHVLPVWGGMPLAGLRKRHVLELLDVVGRSAPVRANRVLAYVKRFLGWCAARDLIDASPAAAVEKPARETRRERLLDDRELVAVWRAAEAMGGPFGAGVRLLICTGARREEIFGARRDELSGEGDAIRLPAERSKTGEGRTIWLSGPARQVLAELPAGIAGEYLVSATGEHRYSAWSGGKTRLDSALARAGESLPGWRLHDLRRTVATGMQRLGVRLEAIEAVLGHVSGSRAGIVGTYQRHQFEQEARAALENWGRYLERLVEGGTADIVQLRGVRR